MEFLKIKETCLYVEDLGKAKDFYHGQLGLSVINHVEGKHLFLRVGQSVLLLFNPEDSRLKTSPPAHFGGGNQHFAFEVKSQAYEQYKLEIAGKGIDIIDEVTWSSGKKSFYFNDPEGNVLEILPQDGVWD
ncbi:MAG TPA: VOC family protein [Chryseosolibacter sp.]|jgi:Predicted ring-cleavage extradiol dioxygenase